MLAAVWGGLLTLFALTPAWAGMYLKLDERGQEHWSSHPTDPGFRIATINEIQHTDSIGSGPDSARWHQHIRSRANVIRPLIRQMGLRYGVDAAWISALIEVESGFNERAVSPKGALGLMQIMPNTALDYGVRNSQDLLYPERNLDVGVRHLRNLLDIHNNNWVLALSAYNAGRSTVSRQGNRIPRYRETMLYVPAILARVEQHRAWLSQQD